MGTPAHAMATTVYSLSAMVVVPALLASSTCMAAKLEDTRPGDTITDNLEVGRRSVPLPLGRWELLSKSEQQTTDGSMTMVRAVMFEVVEKRLTRTLQIEVNKHTGPSRSNWVNEPCKTKGDSYWLEDKKRSFDDQYCLRVGYRSGVVDQAQGEVFLRWARRIRDEGIAYSPDMPFVQVTRFGPGEWVFYEVSFNPQLAGLTPSREAARGLSDWSPLFVDRFDDKRAFYESLRAWAPRLGEAVVKSYRYEPVSTQEVGEPALPQSPSK